ncbi:hypothetical protein SCLCIDRAFT_60034, partial [Scleroderma citrinum Foug A]
HAGTLVQYGWNAGPRHACIFGLVRNIKKKLTGEDCEECDKRILGVFALTWNLLTSALPKEVVKLTCDAIAEADLPVMASQGNVEDSGYQLDLPKGPLIFHTADRAPAEGYMSQNYAS